jgi:hypothetical protein
MGLAGQGTEPKGKHMHHEHTQHGLRFTEQLGDDWIVEATTTNSSPLGPVLESITIRPIGATPPEGLTARIFRTANPGRFYTAALQLQAGKPTQSPPDHLPELVIKRNRHILTDEFLAKVVDVWLNSGGQSPTKTVAEHFGVSRQNARKWLNDAEHRGIIDADTRQQHNKRKQPPAVQ